MIDSPTLRSGPSGSSTNAGGSARRIVLYALLFLLVTLASIGLAGLLGLVLPGETDIAGSDTLELARSLAFTLIAGPLAAVLWMWLWRRIDATERASVGWPLYLAAMGFVSLVVSTVALTSTATAAVGGDWTGRTFATGLVWTVVCLWHNWMNRHATKSPAKLADLLPVSASAYGLLVTAGATAALLTSLLGRVLETGSGLATGEQWWEFPVQALIWSATGAFVWWWYWMHDEARALETGFSDAVTVVVRTAMPVLSAMGGAVTTLFVGLHWAFGDLADTGVEEALPAGVSALLIGSAIWAFHRAPLARRTSAKRIARLLITGFGLVAAASGIGVILNAALDALTQSLVDTNRLGLLFGGISALVVGAPVWFVNWRPAASSHDDRAVFIARSVYLVGVFGASALTALVSLLVIVYRIFVYVLDAGTGLIDEVRAPLGLLVATAMVASYHYPVWRRDRALAATVVKPRSIDHVILVTGADPEPLRRTIVDSTGAAVTVWRRSDTHETGPTTEHLAETLGAASGKRVLVITGPGAHIDVIELET